LNKLEQCHRKLADVRRTSKQTFREATTEFNSTHKRHTGSNAACCRDRIAEISSYRAPVQRLLLHLSPRAIPHQPAAGFREAESNDRIVCSRTRVWTGKPEYLPSALGASRGFHRGGFVRPACCMQDEDWKRKQKTLSLVSSWLTMWVAPKDSATSEPAHLVVMRARGTCVCHGSSL
jgi:hypothetical protein